MVRNGSGRKDNLESEEENPFVEYFAQVESVGAIEGEKRNEPRKKKSARTKTKRRGWKFLDNL